jgi:alkyl hydroperoxide reductase subunit AhpC
LVAFRLRLGSSAPNFKAETTLGLIDFHEWIGDKWAILFSHPEDYTPVCTTELAALSRLEPEFTKRGVKLIGLSANTVETHGGWINDIDEIAGITMTFPIIGDKDRKIAFAYDMVRAPSSLPFFSPNPSPQLQKLGNCILTYSA